MKGLLVLCLLVVSFDTYALPSIYEKKYDGFTLWLSCKRHGALVFKYDLDKDRGNLSRSGIDFDIDPSIPAECQSKTGDSNRTDNVNRSVTGTYDREHLVPANHMDYKFQSFKDTFYVSNILPQQSTFNQASGAWFKTETISECYRDISRLTIWGGA